jgi:hypothetical protein
MGAARPPRSRAQASPTRTCPRRQHPRRPRRWGRLLAVALSLVLIAAVVPRALADDGNDTDLSSWWFSGAADNWTEQAQAAQQLAMNPTA